MKKITKGLNGTRVHVVCKDGTEYIGDVIYAFDAGEGASDEEELDIELIFGTDETSEFRESEIERIEVIN